MSKKTTAIIVISAILVISILAIGGYFATQQTAFFDNYFLEDDFTTLTDLWKLGQKTNTCQAGGAMTKSYEGSYSLENNNLILSTTDGANYRATYDKNLKGFDIKTKVTISYSHPGKSSYGGEGSGSFQILLNNQAIFSGSAPSTYTSSSRTYNIEIVQDTANQEKLYLIIDGEPLVKDDNLVSFQFPEKEIKISFVKTGNRGSCSYPGSGSLSIDYLRLKPFFDCSIEEDEIIIRDKFTQGSFTYQDLTYIPKSWCIDNYPAIRRSLTEQGSRADIMGTISRSLTSGETITIQEGEVFEIFYVVDYQEGMGERCSLDEAYDTESKSCVKIIEEQPDAEIFYNINKVIPIQANQLEFNGQLLFGTSSITTPPPQFLCSETKAVAPSPKESCWKLNPEYNGKEYSMIYDQEIDLSKYLKLRWLPTDLIYDGSIKDGYQNNMILTLDEDILQEKLLIKSEEEHWVIFGSERFLNFEVTNNLDQFDSSGIQITKTDSLGRQTQKQEIINFEKGTNQYSYQISSEQYGEVQYSLRFWYEINGNKIFDDGFVATNYRIVDQIPVNETVVIKTEYQTEIIERNRINKENLKIIAMIIIVLIAFVAALVYAIKKLN